MKGKWIGREPIGGKGDRQIGICSCHPKVSVEQVHKENCKEKGKGALVEEVV